MLAAAQLTPAFREEHIASRDMKMVSGYEDGLTNQNNRKRAASAAVARNPARLGTPVEVFRASRELSKSPRDHPSGLPRV